MKRNTTTIIIILTALAVVLAFSALAFGDTEAEVKELSGTVSFDYYGGFFLKTSSGDEYKLVLGPPWYLDNLGLKLKNGDKVTVKGVDAGYGVLLVATLKKGVKTYNLADIDHLKELPSYYGGPRMLPSYYGGPRMMRRRW